MLAGPRGRINYLDRQEVKASATLTDFARLDFRRAKMLAKCAGGPPAAAE